MENVPVAAPSMTEERLEKMAKAGSYIYAALPLESPDRKTVIDEDAPVHRQSREIRFEFSAVSVSAPANSPGACSHVYRRRRRFRVR